MVETQRAVSVRTIFQDAFGEIYDKAREDWVLSWPGQIVIAGSQTYWTAEVESHLRIGKLKKFIDGALKFNVSGNLIRDPKLWARSIRALFQLDALRSLVKSPLTFLQREILSALIVIEVHARDVTVKLGENKVTNVNDFDWISQLR